MTPLKHLFVAGLLLVPALAIGETQTTRCYAAHFVRDLGPSGPTPDIPVPRELRSTVVFFNNGDLEHPAVVQHIIVRDGDGMVRHDSGPITMTVPAGGTRFFTTALLWGNANPSFIPPGTPLSQVLPLAGAMSVTVEVSKPGKRKLFVVHARENSRQLITTMVDTPQGPTMIQIQGSEASANATRCFRVGGNDDE